MGELITQEGFPYSFDSSACSECKGRCCIGESGYIWLNPKEITRLAEKLNINRDEFINKYLLKIGYRYSIKELVFNDGFKCIFFDTKKQMCSVYEARPAQCRTFPFWDYFKNNIREVEKECPGICKL
ncbi:YkgJ family cysteine cluster protein [Sulfurospirillum arcachonense]|uniref:YkgJ family cysteine cluster protein n=1 Tax=Sulfurospirillum arcachonense TaxID=57666 RepID=UPI0004685233|nr:YkgJ family cysteine cluster protein [Sulfurospirillum arcachonense]